jgi:hypothetical protein
MIIFLWKVAWNKFKIKCSLIYVSKAQDSTDSQMEENIDNIRCDNMSSWSLALTSKLPGQVNNKKTQKGD